MLRQHYIDEKLQQWQCSYDRGIDLAVEILCDGDATVSAAELDQLRQAIDRFRDTQRQLGDSHRSGAAAAVGQSASVPAQVGRYRVDGKLGEGGFGIVYLGFDDQLRRQVAIKVPHARHLADKAIVDAYLFEAQTVAALDHPGIVPVYDVGSTAAHPFFHVSKLIAGTTLAKRAAGRIQPFADTARIIAMIAEALHYAHVRGVVHRDIKPGNILIDPDGRPYLTDFGLALRDSDGNVPGGYSGTPAYMSPEQARGEGHRVDGRSDIFSLGIVLYELLTGRRPFASDSTAKLLEQIATVEPWPPREVNDVVPRELERICLKALSKRVIDRYTTALDLAEDLLDWADQAPGDVRRRVVPPPAVAGVEASRENPGHAPREPHSPVSPASDRLYVKVVPNGLRAFDAGDADFFLELLPGPRDREGLPGSIRFWKTRIEERESEKSFAVGLMYGPSGCGKSSLVKAGLLPRLADHVTPVYVEATGDATERMLQRELLRLCPTVSAHSTLPQLCSTIRRNRGLTSGNKVCLILDQFEQWLHTAPSELAASPLVQALRQCDGGCLQCLIMVRDDFWMAATRLMQVLEVPLVEGFNCHAIDLFPARHARRVLTAFGRAYGELPDAPEPLSADQREFVEQAVSSLADQDKVICVRLSLFAEMVKSRPWTPASLRQFGGMEGVGQAFLHETFSASSAPPHHRYHELAARAVLQALLPESGTDIRGGQRTYSELLECSGYSRRPTDFQSLIQLLDTQLHLITPADTLEPGGDAASGQAVRADRRYQLTHDYLVPSIRQWLTGRQRESRRGRAVLRLADLATHWSARPERRRLPNLWEFLDILAFTRRRDWTATQRRMMTVATRHYLTRTAVVAAVLVAAGLTGIEWRGRQQARILRDQLATASPNSVKSISATMQPYRRWVHPLLRTGIDEARANGLHRRELNFRLALLPSDPSQLEWLKTYMLGAPPDEVEVFRHLLLFREERSEVVPWLWQAVQDGPQSVDDGTGAYGPALPDIASVLPAASILATYDSRSPRWDALNAAVVDELLQMTGKERTQWEGMLTAVQEPLARATERVVADATRPAQERFRAEELLKELKSQYRPGSQQPGPHQP